MQGDHNTSHVVYRSNCILGFFPFFSLQHEKEKDEEENKPEFAKISLRKAQQC